MANRSYIYAYQPNGEPLYRDLGEWKSDVPLAHLLLVGQGTEAVQSMLWSVDERIALQGDAASGLALLRDFLAWLEPQLDADFAREKERALEVLERADRAGERYHLEPGEVYELMMLSLPEMEDETLRYARRAQQLAAEARCLIDAGATLEQSELYEIRQLATSWRETLGLYFLGVLYFHVG